MCIVYLLNCYYHISSMCVQHLAGTNVTSCDSDSELISDSDSVLFQSAERMDQEQLSPHWSELSDLSDLFPVDAGETTQDWGSRHNQMTPFLTPLERLPASQHTSRNRRRQKQ